MKWLINTHRPEEDQVRYTLAHPGSVIVIGPPKVTKYTTIERLKAFGLMGLYEEDV
jgi:hypothetical protein